MRAEAGLGETRAEQRAELSIWAPHARERVEVGIVAGGEGEGRRQSLARGERGRWRGEVVGLAHGVDYVLYVDGRGPYPDPRAPWQPAGAFGPSRHVDHARFVWSDAGFRAVPLAAAVIYELHVGTFTPAGTFDAAIEHLAHLRDLGVTHVELLPVNEFAGERGWGYDGVDLFAPHHAYGGPDGLKRLVDACHRASLAVLIDVVYNHFGPAGNFLPVFGPYLTDAHRTPWGAAVNLEHRGSDEVRRFFCDNALMWLRDYHVDGLRLDAVHMYQDHSAVHLMEQLAREVEALEASVGRPLVLIAESDLNDPRVVNAWEAGGYGLDAQWSDDFHHALHALLTGERVGFYADFGALATLAKALERVFVLDGCWSEFRGYSHGRSAGDTPRTRFLAYLQNHDQIGNRPTGERSAALMSEGRLRIGAALVLAGPFVPMLFQGEEWGSRGVFQFFTDHRDAELGRAVRVGREAEMRAFGWTVSAVPDPQAEATLVASRLDWAELGQPRAQAMLDWHRRLIRLRRLRPKGSAPTVARFDEAAGWMTVDCSGILIAFNLGPEPISVPLPEQASGARPWHLTMAWPAGIQAAGGGVTLGPDELAIFTQPGG
jgi:maltooligosyltrehalose trehalohydrolase